MTGCVGDWLLTACLVCDLRSTTLLSSYLGEGNIQKTLPCIYSSCYISPEWSCSWGFTRRPHPKLWSTHALLWWPKAHSLHWAHYTSWTAINTMELKVPRFGLGKKVSGLESRRLLQNSWVPSPLSTSEAHGHLMPSSGGIWHLWSLNTLTCTHTLMSIAKHLHIHTILKLIKQKLKGYQGLIVSQF